MARATYTERVETKGHLDYPDEFDIDDTPRGQAVDAVLKVQLTSRSRLSDDLFSGDRFRVERAGRVFSEAYQMVDAVLNVVGPAPLRTALDKTAERVERWYDEAHPPAKLTDPFMSDLRAIWTDAGMSEDGGVCRFMPREATVSC